VAGADVEVISGPAGGSATSDLCGRYMLKLPRDGAYTLRAHSGTALSARQTALVPPSREDLSLTLGAPAQGYAVTFRVVDQAGQGVPGAGLSVESDSTVDYGRTDSAGLFTATLPAGAYQWGVYAECMVDSATHSFSLPGTSSEQLSLHRVTNRVSGRVTDRYRRPLYGANVTAQGAAGVAETITDSNGYYALRLSPGAWTLSAEASPCAHGPASRSVTVPGDQTGVDLALDGEDPPAMALYLPLIGGR